MKDTKRRLEVFSLYDRTGLETHLARMAEKGWLLTGVGQLFWTYKAMEPKKLTFSVCYFPKASTFDPGPTEEQETFYDFCAHTGWQLAASNGQLQIFYNERENPIPIETDPVMEVETIHKTMKRTTLPSHLSLLAVGLLNMGMTLSSLGRDFIGTLAAPSSLLSTLCWVLVFLLSITELGGYFRWHRKAVQEAEKGQFLPSKSHRGLQYAALWMLTAALGLYFLTIFTSGNRFLMVLAALMFFLYLPGIFLAVLGIKSLLKKKGASRGLNRAVTLGACVVLPTVLMAAITAGILFGSSRNWFEDGDAETYVANGHTWTAHHDEVPLTVGQLVDGVDESLYSHERRADNSPLLTDSEYDLRPRWDMDEGLRRTLPHLDYRVVEVKVPFLYERCREQLLHDRDDWNEGMPEEEWYAYVPVDAGPWGAEAAYRMTVGGESRSQFLLCYPDRLVEINLWGFSEDSWSPTAEQMALVGEALGK